MKRLLMRRTQADRPALEPARSEAIQVWLPAGFDANADGSKLLDNLEPVHGRGWRITRVRDGIAHLEKVEPTLLGHLSMLDLTTESDWKEPGSCIDVPTHDLLTALIMTKERHNLEGHPIRDTVADFNAVAYNARSAKALTCRVNKNDLREFVLVIRHLENQYLRKLSEIGIPHQHAEPPLGHFSTDNSATVPSTSVGQLRSKHLRDYPGRASRSIRLRG